MWAPPDSGIRACGATRFARLQENTLDTQPTLTQTLPVDASRATLVGRAWLPGERGGPAPVLVRDGELVDLSPLAATTSSRSSRC